MLEGPEDDGVPATIAILRGPELGGSTLEAATARSRRAIEKRYGGSAAPSAVRLGGRKALQLEYRPEGRRARAIVAAYDGRLYSVTFEATEGQFRREEQVFQDMLASWRWDGP